MRSLARFSGFSLLGSIIVSSKPFAVSKVFQYWKCSFFDSFFLFTGVLSGLDNFSK